MWPFSRKAELPPRTVVTSGFKLIGHDGLYQWTPQPDLTPAEAADVSILTAWIMAWGGGTRKNDIGTWVKRSGLERHFRFTPNAD